jgi:DNA-binding MarR family transcriptional regulator
MTQAPESVTEDNALVSALYAVLVRLPHVRIDERVDKTGLAILHELHRAGTTRPSDLAALMHVDLSTISRHLQALETAGMVVRSRDPEDARAQRIDLTPRGDEVLVRFLDGRSASLRDAISHWPAEDRTVLRQHLGRLADDLSRVAVPAYTCPDPRHQ